jgi:hypothetical protein
LRLAQGREREGIHGLVGADQEEAIQHSGKVDPLLQTRPLQILAHTGHRGAAADDQAVRRGRLRKEASNRARQKAQVLLRGQPAEVADEEHVLRDSQNRAEAGAMAHEIRWARGGRLSARPWRA